MSNFSRTYQCYLLGYIGDVIHNISECQMQALALGVHHRTTGKPPLLRSVEVTAALRGQKKLDAMPGDSPPQSKPLVGNIILKSINPVSKIQAIKAIRDVTTPTMRFRDRPDVAAIGLKEAKDIADNVCAGHAYRLFGEALGERVEQPAAHLRGAGIVIEVE